MRWFDRLFSRAVDDAIMNLRADLQDIAGVDSAAIEPVIRSFDQLAAHGRDLHAMTNHIMAMGLTGLTRGGAGALALHIANRVSGIRGRDQWMALGIQQAKWLYSGAPCVPSWRRPVVADLARGAAHKAASGVVYDIDRGICLEGQWTFPGQEPGCKCVATPIVADFDS